jgi:Flp pilus assembly protein TadD
MARNPALVNALLATAAAGLVLAGATAALAKDKPPSPGAPAAASKPGQAVAAPVAPRKATAEERAVAERLEPLARAAFWAHEAQIDPRDQEAGVRLAAALRALGRNEEAAAAAGQVLVLDPDSPAALLEQARAFIAGGQGFFAVDPLTKLEARTPRDWRVFSLLGVAYEQVSRLEDAEAAWKKALELSPDNPAVLSNLAMHAAAAGRAGEAETLLRKAVLQPGSDLKVRQNLALVLGLEGKLDEAEKIQRQDLPPELAEANMAYLRAAASPPAAPIR